MPNRWEVGIDGRRCTLLAYGGAGPMHAVEVARAFSIDKVVVPAHSGVFSALGCAEAEMSYSRQQTLRMAVADWDRQRLHRTRRDLEARLARLRLRPTRRVRSHPAVLQPPARRTGSSLVRFILATPLQT